MKEGRPSEACPKFEESQKLDPGLGTLFNLADCYERVGRTASAWGAFSEVADMAKRSGQAERSEAARQRAVQVQPRVPKLRLRMRAPPPGLVLRLDGRQVSVAVLDSELPVDPGEHKVGAAAPGKVAMEKSLRFDAGVSVVNIEPLADVKGEPPPPLGRNPQSHWPWQKSAAIGAGAAGIVGLGVGTVFGLQASSQWSDGQAACPGNVCTPAGRNAWDDARSSAGVSTISFAAGAVLVAAAAFLWFTAPSSSTAPAPRIGAHEASP